MLNTGLQNTRFTWIYTIKTTHLSQQIMTGETFKFRNEGTGVFSIILQEYRSDENISIISKSISFDIIKYNCGMFDSSLYEFSGANSYYAHFKFDEDFTKTSDIVFSITNEKIAVIESVEYNEENGIYYVKIKCLKNGKTEIVATVDGKRLNFEKTKYVTSTKLTVDDISVSIFKRPFLMTIFVLTIISVIVFVIITLINVRRVKRGY